jgi:deaminated glutathione amidase
MKAALLQLTSGDDPAANLAVVRSMMRQAQGAGAGFVLTPEVTNCVSPDRAQQAAVLSHQCDDPTLTGLQQEARALGIWLLIGSLALKTRDPDGRFANRSFLIAPDGEIRASYDKIHMFDVQVTETETYRESTGYRPGDKAVLADAGFAQIGMTICYDLRFPHLYRMLAQAGAQVLTIPAAFSPITGAAHWVPLLRARAIETGCYVLAPAQTGLHPSTTGGTRQTYGHSLAISPWGEVLSDAGTAPGITYVDLDMDTVAQARARVPALTHDRKFTPPHV